MTKLEEARETWRRVSSRFKTASPTRVAYMGDGRGYAASNMRVPGAPHLIYARESPEDPNYFVVQNRTVQPAFNKQILIGYLDHEPNTEQVIDFITESVLYNSDASTIGGVVAHAPQHHFGGGDETYVDPRLFLPGLVYPTNPPSTSLNISPFSYYYKKWDRFGGDTTISITSQYKPSGSQSRYVLIALDPESREIVYRPGQLFDKDTAEFAGIAGGNPGGGFGFVPAPAGDEYPLGAVKLDASTVELDWSSATTDNVIETRLHIMTPHRRFLERIEGIEGFLGLGAEQALPATGAQASSSDAFKANANLLQGVPISTTAPTNQQSLVYLAAQNAWAPSTITGGGGGGGGAVSTGENLGSGIGVFRELSASKLLFKSLSQTDNITLASGASEISVGAHNVVTSGTNLGSGHSVFRERSGSLLTMRSLSPGVNIEIKTSTSTIDISPPERHFNEIYSASTWNSLTIPIWQAAKASNIVFNQFDANVLGAAAASLSFMLEKRPFGSLGTTGESMFAVNQTATQGGVRATNFNGNASILVGEQHLMLTTGSDALSGAASIDFISITGYYNFTALSPANLGTQYLLLEIGDKILLEEGGGVLLENL